MSTKTHYQALNHQTGLQQSQFVELTQIMEQQQPVVILQSSGHIYFCNESFLEMVGLSSKQIYTQHLFDYIHREDAQPVLDIILSLMNTPSREKRYYMLRVKTARGTYLLREVSIKLVFRHSEVIGIKMEFSAE